MPASLSARRHVRARTPRSRLTTSLLTAAATVAAVSGSLAATPRVAALGPVAALPPAPSVSPDALDAMAGEAAATPPPPAAPAPEPARTSAPPSPPAPPAPAPVQALAASRPAVVAPPVVVQPAAPRIRNLLVSADHSLDTGVGVYTDCSGDTPLTRVVAAVDTCVRGRTYFVGHDPGVFTPLMSMSVGEVITWYDAGGVAHPMRIVSIRDGWASANGAPPLAQSNVVAQMQTCEPYSPTGAYDRIVDLVRA